MNNTTFAGEMKTVLSYILCLTEKHALYMVHFVEFSVPGYPFDTASWTEIVPKNVAKSYAKCTFKATSTEMCEEAYG